MHEFFRLTQGLGRLFFRWYQPDQVRGFVEVACSMTTNATSQRIKRTPEHFKSLAAVTSKDLIRNNFPFWDARTGRAALWLVVAIGSAAMTPPRALHRIPLVSRQA
jgi:hypothetical protein